MNVPPKIKITKEEIINAAIKIIKEHGYEKLNARSLAKELGCSVQPIFREFSGMEDLKKTVMAEVVEIYSKYFFDSMSKEDSLIGLEMAYIRFAQEQKNLFRLIYMSDRIGISGAGEFTGVGINYEVVKAMADMTGLSLEKAASLYTGTFFAAHGIAALLATNHCAFKDEEIVEIIGNVFDGLVMKLRDGEDKQPSGREAEC